MDLIKIVEELRRERTMIEESILILERIARGQGKRRGRPPQWMVAAGQKRQGRSSPYQGRAKAELSRPEAERSAGSNVRSER